MLLRAITCHVCNDQCNSKPTWGVFIEELQSLLDRTRYSFVVTEKKGTCLNVMLFLMERLFYLITRKNNLTLLTKYFKCYLLFPPPPKKMLWKTSQCLQKRPPHFLFLTQSLSCRDSVNYHISFNKYVWCLSYFQQIWSIKLIFSQYLYFFFIKYFQEKARLFKCFVKLTVLNASSLKHHLFAVVTWYIVIFEKYNLLVCEQPAFCLSHRINHIFVTSNRVKAAMESVK